MILYHTVLDYIILYYLYTCWLSNYIPYIVTNYIVTIFTLFIWKNVDMVILRPGPLCCPEIYRDVPGKFHDDDDDDDWRSSMNVRVSRGWENSTLIEDLQWMEEFNGRGRIKPLLKIFNEWKSLTGVGELNPYWRSSMNVRVSRGWENSTLIEDLQWMEGFNGRGRIKPLLKIFNEWKSLTGVGELNPYWRSSMNGRV